MKSVIPCLLNLSLVMVSETTASARLGESEAQVVQRLVKPFSKKHFTWRDKENFPLNGFPIVVTLINGQSVDEIYRIPTGTLTDVQLVTLLDANSEGFSWDEIPPNEIPKDIIHPIKQIWRKPNGSTAVSVGYSIEFWISSGDSINSNNRSHRPGCQ